MQGDVEAGVGQLPRGLAPGQATTDDPHATNRVCHDFLLPYVDDDGKTHQRRERTRAEGRAA
jgi:hypothetical protein